MGACCDMAIAPASARFARTRCAGVIPARIIPQLCAAMGVRSRRRYAVAGELFDAAPARRIGLVHEVCADDRLDRAATPTMEAALRNAPDAVRDSKQFVLARAGLDLSAQRLEALAAGRRSGGRRPRPREGLASLRDRRDPDRYRPAREGMPP
jgi:methylglutaconyl-CoA hydratase